ncbi:lipocalin-like domain-containing protein [Spirosoma endbachense]|uniref:Lipocalin-like domain-containing protein n=1 Tax=Spirosoma endbachense TaxID=2666025 RepID=A0A6P1VRX9_9BACT|nr:lipocalin family protein [Spirosoma endbachense]QHV95445.1 hypothetical protein GJR95_10685 [Spirosoma endbachense]
MNRLRIAFSSLVLIALIFSCSEQPVCGCVFPESPLKGDWNLTKITYGLTQKTVTPAEAGYTETISFVNGSFKQSRNGIPVQTSAYTYAFPNGGISDGLIYYQTDTTQQSFRLSENKLFLSERSPRGVAIADGATYEYSR